MVEAERPLGLQRALEHALAGEDASGRDLLRGPVGDEGDLEAGLEQPERELQPGLPGSDDRHPRHVVTRRSAAR